MTVVIGVGGPKGGVGKTTLALNMATHATRELGLATLLVDTDANRSALQAATAAGDAMPFEVATSAEPSELAGLHSTGFDMVVVDLPGGGHPQRFDTVLAGLDLLALPTRPELMDLRPLLSFVDTEVRAAGVPYLLALTRVHRDRVRAAEARRKELRSLGYHVASSYTRALIAHDDACELAKPLRDLPGGRHSTAAVADREYRALITELFTIAGLGRDTPRIPRPPVESTDSCYGHSPHAC